MNNENFPCFAIIGYDNLSQPFSNIGTGFFINDKGYFITASHTFRIKSRKYFAVLGDRRYEIDQVFSEYEDMENQVFPSHKDLTIGFVIGISENSFYPLACDNNQNGEELIAIGFARAQYGINKFQKDVPLGIIRNSICGLEKGFVSIDLKEINFSQLKANFDRNGLLRIYFLGPREELTNGFRFNLEINNIEPAGLSGGPILKNGNVIGLLISKDAAISANYIIEKLSSLNIPFTKHDK